jgi:transposase
MPRRTTYPRELRERAVRMVAEIGEPGAVRRVAEKLGVGRDALRCWIKNAPAELGGKSGLTSDQLEMHLSSSVRMAETRRNDESSG